jgi:hypothetical protein
LFLTEWGSGLANLQSVSSSIVNITDLTVSLYIAGGSFPAFTGINGDLYAYVQHSTGFSVLLNRPGMDGGNPLGYFDDGGIRAGFNDAGLNGNAHTYQTVPGPGAPPSGVPVVGVFQPDGRNIDSLTSTAAAVGSAPSTALLSSFNGLDANGGWTLYVEDMFGDGSTFVLNNWSLEITGDNGVAAIPEPRAMLPLALLFAFALLRRR